MLTDYTRRLELGKMLLDVSKYILTIVVVGGLVSNRVPVETLVLGFSLTLALLGMGWQILPEKEEAR